MAQNPPIQNFNTPGPPLFTPPIPQPATSPPVGPDCVAAPIGVSPAAPATTNVTVVYAVPQIAPTISPVFCPYLDYSVSTFYVRDLGATG